MTYLTKLFSRLGTLIAPRKLQVQPVKARSAQPVPYWSDFLRNRDDAKR